MPAAAGASSEPAPVPAADAGSAASAAAVGPASDPASGPRRGRPGYDQQTVLNVAVDVFNRHGYEATSMGILAENLGITKSAIYHHVPSKGDLLRLALDYALDGLEAVLDDPRASAGAADARLEFVLRGTIEVLTERLPFVTLLLRLRGNTDVERSALARRREFDHRVAGLVDAARREGSVRSDIDPRTTTRLLFGTINSIVEWYKPGGPLPAQKLADNIITMVFDGLHTRRS
ncbi:TetR/AcrR family transcriptional regulator [Arthrobacter sp. zg-Y1110]|uniref:TetR/AcrR family transcriptional regulator n=1 Tax=Arthrobacter sp. zg-Y1110 TaxID=2886932 RepID=UPI001D140BCD|nr:TetR/AcrR family transcriptional regulator [Arthrobacter sp. zg-Y1110]MCC3290122.1 TetR/AcrR family transcriptional regulator [Arthrobacter sp. zg-Y1110]UWX84486.1 TetR/AcrR family transcriptional regulator [Arthrobacter sp. zg-Y1110]